MTDDDRATRIAVENFEIWQAEPWWHPLRRRMLKRDCIWWLRNLATQRAADEAVLERVSADLRKERAISQRLRAALESSTLLIDGAHCQHCARTQKINRVALDAPIGSTCPWCKCVGYHSEFCEGFDVNDPAAVAPVSAKGAKA